MNCQTVQSGNVVERYVLGQLSEAEQSSFEDHYFGCDPCFEEVRLMQALQAAAAERPGRSNAVPMPARNWKLWAAAAAVVVAGLGLSQMRPPGQRTEVRMAQVLRKAAPAELELLARVEAPKYTASTLRSAAATRDEKFRAAMAKYSAGEYRAAEEALRGLTAGGTETAAARFYLGVSDLMTGDVNEALAQLGSTAAMGETPYLEEARFFLAKAQLAKHDVGGAIATLEQTAALAGDREAEARHMLEALRALPAGQ